MECGNKAPTILYLCQNSHVNIEPEILHGNCSSYWKYNEV